MFMAPFNFINSVGPQRLGRIGSLSLILLGAGATSLNAQQVVYDNTVTSLNYGLPINGEVADEITLGGTARNITDVEFEYFGTWIPHGDEAAQMRFYLNDGDVVDLYGSRAPKTVIWESPLFQANTNYNSVAIHDLNILVPDDFTVSLQFFGLSSSDHEQAEVLLYNPPAVGASYNDYWQKVGSLWSLYETDGVADNFALHLTAAIGLPPDGTIQSQVIQNRLRLSWTGANYKLQHASVFNDPAAWTDVAGAGSNSASILIGSGNEFFRLTSLSGGVLKAQVLGTQMQITWTGTGYSLQQNDSLDNSSGWTLVPSEANAATVDISNGNKFFRLQKLQ